LTGSASTSNSLASALADGPTSNDKLSLNVNSTRWTLASTNIYSGNTSITNNGTLALVGSGSIANSPIVQIASGSKFDVSGLTGGANYNGTNYMLAMGQLMKGTGMVFGPMGVSANSTVAPGNSIGTLNTSSISFDAATSSYNPEIDFGGTPGSDLLNVTGTVAFNNSSLDLAPLNVPIPSGFAGPKTFIIVANDGSDPVTGVFGTINNLPTGYTATVNYGFTGTDASGRVGDGNDVAITISTIPVPEPSSFVLLAISGLLGVLVVRRRTDQ
jgi:hypothetical protein